MQDVFVHFSGVIFFSVIHLFKIIKNVSFEGTSFKDFKHLMCGLGVEEIAVFRLDDLLIFHVIESIEVFVVDVLNVDPFNKEEALELE